MAFYIYDENNEKNIHENEVILLPPSTEAVSKNIELDSNELENDGVINEVFEEVTDDLKFDKNIYKPDFVPDAKLKPRPSELFVIQCFFSALLVIIAVILKWTNTFPKDMQTSISNQISQKSSFEELNEELWAFISKSELLSAAFSLPNGDNDDATQVDGTTPMDVITPTITVTPAVTAVLTGEASPKSVSPTAN